jgi:Outer membrane protein beta-barrel domain
MRSTIFIILILFFTLFTEGGIWAQQQPVSRFKAGAMVGFNLAQIHGDNQDGYGKKGSSLGLNGSMVILPDFDICTELLYNERGAAQSTYSDYRVNQYYTEIDLKYSEMAILARYYFMPRMLENYYRQSIKIGVSYGRLLKSQTSVLRNRTLITPIAESLTQDYNRNDVSFVAAWSFYFTPRVSVEIRHTNTLNYLYKTNPNVGIYQDMRPYFLSFHFNYDFIAAKGMKIKSRRFLNKRRDPLEELY